MDKYNGPRSTTTEDVLMLDGVDDNRKRYTTYEWMGTPVPRVSELISSCTTTEFLIRWATKLGEKEYNEEKKKALDIGTLAHEFIANYCMEGISRYDKVELQKYKMNISEGAICALNNYRSFESNLKETYGITVKSIYSELPIVTPWYGGTIDSISEVTFPNGISEYVIVDYKTSRRISTNYILQTYAYMWAVNFLKTNNIRNDLPNITGIMVVRVDKSIPHSYDHIFMDIYHNFAEFQQLERDLGNLINWFYSQSNLNYLLKVSKEEARRMLEANYGENIDSDIH